MEDVKLLVISFFIESSRVVYTASCRASSREVKHYQLTKTALFLCSSGKISVIFRDLQHVDLLVTMGRIL